MRKSIELLQRAHSYIEAGELSEARALLEPALAANPDDPDLWWFYAHAVEDPEAGMEALENVARLDPSYPGIDELTARIQESATVDIADYDDGIDDLPYEDVDYENADVNVETKPRSRRLIPLIAILLIIVCLAIVALLVNNQGQGVQPTATAVLEAESTTPPTSAAIAVVPTITPFPDATQQPVEQETATEDVTEGGSVSAEIVETQESTSEATESGSSEPTDELSTVLISQLQTSLEDYQIPENGIYETETPLGRTLILQTCSGIGPQATNAMNGIFENLGDRADQSLAFFDGFAVEVYDCEANQSIRTIAVERQAALDFAAGTIDLRGFQRFWQPIN